MAWTSPTEIDATSGVGSTFEYLNLVSNFWFGRMLMIAIFLIFFLGYLGARRDDFLGAFAVASYVSFVLGLLFWVIDLVSGLDFAIIIALAIVSSALLLVQKKSY